MPSTHTRSDRPHEDITSQVIRAACEVHAHLGPGYPEGVYEDSLCFEFERRGVPFERQRTIGVHYKGASVGHAKVDLIVASTVVVELESVLRVLRVHRAQLISYLKVLDLQVGLILNFKVPAMQRGVHRVHLHDGMAY